jgi:hypothetical protein
MGNIPTGQVQQKHQQLTCCITLLPKDIIQYLVNFLGYYNARNLNQTCILFHQCVLHELIPHKCVPPSTKEISNCDIDWKRLENDELALSEGLILKIPLDSAWIDLIQYYCPKLKYLFIWYSCKCAASNLYFSGLPWIEMSMKINMLNMNCELSIELPPNLRNFTAHISRIDPATSKTISSESKGGINLTIKTLKKLKFL